MALQHENEQLRAQLTRQGEAFDLLRRQMAEVLRRLYGRTSEKLDPGQLKLSFGELAEGIIAAQSPQDEPGTTAPDDEESVVDKTAVRAGRQGASSQPPLLQGVTLRRGLRLVL